MGDWSGADPSAAGNVDVPLDSTPRAAAGVVACSVRGNGARREVVRGGSLGRAPEQALRRRRRGQGRGLRGAAGRGLRAARAQRRGQDHDHRDPRRIPPARPGPGRGARLRPRRHRPPAGSCGSTLGVVLQELAVEPFLSVRQALTRNAGYYPRSAPGRRGARARRARGQGRRTGSRRSRAASSGDSTSGSGSSGTPSCWCSTSPPPASTPRLVVALGTWSGR